jgi:hypothetical protein
VHHKKSNCSVTLQLLWDEYQESQLGGINYADLLSDEHFTVDGADRSLGGNEAL